MEIADYDSTHYDYTKYWQGRNYEDFVDKAALLKLLPPTGNSLIDIGGGFGRLLREYAEKYQQLTLLDYSGENLSKARADPVLATTTNFIQGDVYQLPFPDNSFDAGFMIRVMHHLEAPKKALGEIYRIMKPGSIFVLEFANKCHFKALLKQGLGFCRDLTPYSQLTKGSGVFLNHHPKAIEDITTSLGWKIEEKLSVSNLRWPQLKRLLPLRLLISIEISLQKPLSYINFGPSIFLRLKKTT